MVECQVLTADVVDPVILAAMRAVPRERFVPAAPRAIAYSETCIEVAPGRFLIDPRSFAKLVQLAQIGPHDSVLDVGCTIGYSTAVLSLIAGAVTGLEEDAALVRLASETLSATGFKAQVVEGRLADGLPQHAPFDVIFLNGGVEVRPTRLLEQLGDEGRLVCAWREGAAGFGRLYLKHDGAIGARDDFDAALPVLPGFAKKPAFAF